MDRAPDILELISAMKQKGEKASYAESNTTGKVMGELYKLATGVQALDVPYRTANDSINDFASGAVFTGWRSTSISLDRRQ